MDMYTHPLVKQQQLQLAFNVKMAQAAEVRYIGRRAGFPRCLYSINHLQRTGGERRVRNAGCSRLALLWLCANVLVLTADAENNLWAVRRAAMRRSKG
jgi:hypothetical protein